MERSEVLKYVGKYVNIKYAGVDGKQYCYPGYILIHESLDRWSTYYGFFKDDLCKNEHLFSYIRFLDTCDLSMSYIHNIEEIEYDDSAGLTIYECFGKEIEDWISKPIEQVSINLSKYPHNCPYCNFPAWVNPVTNHIDCSNKNCKGI